MGGKPKKNLIDHFKQLLQFSGRENGAAFWPYACLVIALAFVATAGAIMPVMLTTMARMQQFAREHPDQATVTQSPGHYSIEIEGYHPELMADFGGFAGSMALISIGVIALLAAAVARRLHDRGKSGAWGLLPLPFLTFGLYQMPQLFTAAEPDVGAFMLLFANNFVYIGCLAYLVVVLLGRSDPAANAYGEG